MTNKFGKGVLWCYYRNKIIFSRINIWENTNRKKLEKLEKITKSCVLTLKRLRGQFDPPPPSLLWFFKKWIFLTKGETLIFCDFSIIISHIFPENVIEIPQAVWKIWRISIFIDSHWFFGFFDVYLLQRN